MTESPALRAIEGQECWYVSIGGCTYPSFELALGAKVPRAQPLGNQRQDAVFRENDPSHSLLVWCCWRLRTESEVLGTGSDPESDSSESPLCVLVGQRVVSVRCEAPVWDLRLSFTGGFVLDLFAESSGREGSGLPNWELRVPGRYAAAGPGCAWTEESS